jgi:cell wall-associated NlpC family hydrolase
MGVERGQPATLSVNLRGERACRLVAGGIAGRKQSMPLPRGGGSYGVYLTISPRARSGPWSLRVRCTGASSATHYLIVAAPAAPARRAGPALTSHLTTRRIGGRPPDGFTAPRRSQQGSDAPGLGLTAADLAGRGGGDGGRGTRAIAWALAQQGRTDYSGWCLRFVAHAYGQSTYRPTATIAANELRPRDGRLRASKAPAGSLVWFHWIDPHNGVNYGHVGISLGDGRMVDALSTVRIDRIDGSPFWRSRYRGWTPAPISWPGRPAPAPASTTEPPTPVTQIPPPLRKVLTVDNRVTDGMSMREDTTPLRLATEPKINCGSRGCNINGTERTSGGTYDSAVCQTTGERTTNGQDGNAVDDANPELFESTRYYGVRLADNTFGYVNEIWVRAADRGGLGLPAC